MCIIDNYEQKTETAVSIMSQFVALSFQEVNTTNKKAVTLIHPYNGIITE